MKKQRNLKGALLGHWMQPHSATGSWNKSLNFIQHPIRLPIPMHPQCQGKVWWKGHISILHLDVKQNTSSTQGKWTFPIR